TVTDTLWVRNPGWHSAQYATYGTCSWTTPIDHCALSGIPATVSVGAGASLGIPFTYTTPSAYPFSTTINFVATYTNSLGQRRAYLTASPTTGALIPPTITLTPSDGATVSTATVDITARWCDEDDGIMQRAVIWQGRPLSMDSVVDDPSCTNGSRYAWR